MLLPQSFFESFLKETEFRDQVSQGVHKSVGRIVVRSGLHTDDYLDKKVLNTVVVIDLADLVFKRTWVFVPRKDHIWVLEQLVPDHVAQSVVLLVEGEDGRVGHLGVLLPRDLLLAIEEDERLKGGRSVHHRELGGCTEIAAGSSWKVLDRLSGRNPMLLSTTFWLEAKNGN